LDIKVIIKNLLKEALGVPHNIYEASEKCYKRIYNWTKRLSEKDFEGGMGASVAFRVDFNIADYNFTTLRVRLGIERHSSFSEPEIMSMVTQTQSKKTEDLKLDPIKTKTVDLVIVLVVPEEFEYSELPEFFEKNKNEIIESISHELKHAYDHAKKLIDHPEERAGYQSVMQLGFGVTALDRFIHDIYYSSANENLVRPTEIASAIKNNQISQKDFLKFLQNNETYQNLKRISEFNIEKFKQDILKEKGAVGALLRKFKYKPSKMSDDEKIQVIFNILYKSIVGAKIEVYKDIITQNFLENIFGFKDEKEKIFKKFINRNTKFTNPEDFVKFYEKYFNFVGRNMLKKVSKLYAITHK